MYNKVIMIGNLTKDAEMKYLPSGTAVVNFKIAVNTKYSDKEEVLFIDSVLFGKMAESLSKYLNKGVKCLVEGRLVERRWESDGQQKSKMEIVVSQVRLLGGKKDTNNESKTSSSPPPTDESTLEPF